MIDKKKVLAIAVFIFFGFFMFAFANPSDGIRKNLEEDTANDQNVTPVVDNNATVNNDQLLNIPAVDNVVNVITEENAPTITLGENVNSMEVNGLIPEFNATVDNGTLEITHNINPKEIGTYEVTFTATSDGGQTTVIIIEFYVVDTTKPVIELNGEDVIIVRMGHDYVEPGYEALDNYDGNITDKVLVNNSDFDTNSKGEHLITYNVSDNQGNKADEVVRKVIVTDATELVNIIESGNEIIEETTNKDVSDKLEELLDELKEEIENGNKIVEDLESEQKIIDDKTEEIEEIINQIKNMTFNVKFVDYDDSIIYETTAKYMETVDAPENPTRKGYTFSSWDKLAENIVNDIVIKAIYEINNYTIEYELNGGKINKVLPEKYTVETDDIILVNPTKEGYTFVGWYNGNNKIEKIEKGTTGNLVLVAQYEANKDTKYTVEVYEETLTQDEYLKVDTLSLKGETDKEVTYELASRTGFTGTTQNVKGTVASDGSLVLKAYYKRNSYKLTVDTKEETKKYGESILLEEPSKEGYTFIGWSEKVPATMPAKNLTVMSMWKANKYQVTFYDDDQKTVLFTKTYEYDQTVDLANVKTPTKDSTNTKVFKFDGWSNGSKIVESFKIKGDSSLYATYSSSTRYYEVVFKDYDGTVLSKQDNIEYNNDAIAPENPTRENYIFTGWDKDYHNVTKNLIITAQYKAKQIGIKVVEKPNVQFEFQKNTKADLSKLIVVYDVYADGSEKETKEYTTDIDTSTVVSNKTLTISHNGFNDTSIKYSVINEEAFQSKFEVIFKSGSYRETKSSYCKKNCDNEKNTRQVILNQDFLEIIEHYNELIKVTKVLARFNNGTSEALELSDMVRYSYISSRGWFNISYFSPVRIATSRVTKVFSEATAINKVEITYNREGYGNYVVVFKNNNGIYVPIDEYKLK